MVFQLIDFYSGETRDPSVFIGGRDASLTRQIVLSLTDVANETSLQVCVTHCVKFGQKFLTFILVSIAVKDMHKVNKHLLLSEKQYAAATAGSDDFCAPDLAAAKMTVGNN